MINKESTEQYLRKSHEHIIVHRGTYDEVSKIIQNKRIIRNKLVSFSDGFPFMPMHGDTSIVFDREKMIKKCNFLKIEYTKDFFKNKKELLDYVMEYKTKTEMTEYLVKIYQNDAEKIKEILDTLDDENKNICKQKIRKIENEIPKVKKNPMWYFFKTIENENEIITDSPFEFIFEDIEKIIYASSEFQKLYPFPNELQDKVMYMDDFFPIAILPGSPLSKEIESKEQKFLMIGAESIDTHIFILHHVVAAIVKDPDLIIDVKINHLNYNKIPSNWIRVMKNIDKIIDQDFKIEIIDYVWRICMLYSSATLNYKYYDRLLKKALDIIK